MNPDLARTMWTARDRPIDRAEWEAIITGLYDDFESLVGEKFERDPQPSIRAQDTQFAAWMWSNRKENSPVSLNWSGVIAGCIGRDESGSDSLVVTADVFLFHGPDNERLVTAGGKHFLQFHYKRTGPAQGEWRYLGWVRDEWGEWEDVPFGAG
jgi:hypothetical protein